jgi:hypothetical protein
MGRDTAFGLAYVKTRAGHIHFRQPADLEALAVGRSAGDGGHDHLHGAAGGLQVVPSDHPDNQRADRSACLR